MTWEVLIFWSSFFELFESLHRVHDLKCNSIGLWSKSPSKTIGLSCNLYIWLACIQWQISGWEVVARLDTPQHTDIFAKPLYQCWWTEVFIVERTVSCREHGLVRHSLTHHYSHECGNINELFDWGRYLKLLQIFRHLLLDSAFNLLLIKLNLLLFNFHLGLLEDPAFAHGVLIELINVFVTVVDSVNWTIGKSISFFQLLFSL